MRNGLLATQGASRVRKVLAPIVLIVVGLVGAVALVKSKTPVETVRPLAVDPLVRVVPARFARVPLSVAAQGTVLPRTETTLVAQVAAEVVAVSPHFEAGGFFQRGEVLVRLDRRDFELLAEGAAAKVAQAELRLTRQQAEARVAAEEWQTLGEGEPDPLVLRQPQMAEARAMLRAAEAELGMARLALERTVLRAPFDGRLRRKRVGVGQYLTPGTEVATIHAVDYAEIRLPVPDRQLAFLDLPLGWADGPVAQPSAELSANFAGRRHRWPGTIVRTEGELDSRSRMLHLVARVEDPYDRRGTGRPPLAVGLFVDAEIAGRTVDGALLPRSALRAGQQVMVVDDEDRLRFRDVGVVRTEKDAVVIGSGLAEGERVCVSPLDVVVDGMRVRTVEVEGPAPLLRTAPGQDPEPAVAAVDVAAPPISGPAAGDQVPEPEAPPAAGVAAVSFSGRLRTVHLLHAGDGAAFQVSVGGDFSYSTSRLDSPARFVIDLLGVAKADPRSAVEVAEGPVERLRIGQYQATPEPITRLVFDLRSEASPEIERAEDGLTVRF